jgi:hypothetical protein
LLLNPFNIYWKKVCSKHSNFLFNVSRSQSFSLKERNERKDFAVRVIKFISVYYWDIKREDSFHSVFTSKKKEKDLSVLLLCCKNEPQIPSILFIILIFVSLHVIEVLFCCYSLRSQRGGSLSSSWPFWRNSCNQEEIWQRYSINLNFFEKQSNSNKNEGISYFDTLIWWVSECVCVW